MGRVTEGTGSEIDFVKFLHCGKVYNHDKFFNVGEQCS